LYPIGDLVAGTRLIKYYNFLQESQWWQEEKLRRWQDDKLALLIRHAYANVPYYKHLFDRCGIDPESIKESSDLKRIPVLTKDIIRNNFNDLVSLDVSKRKPRLACTSGSTGAPLKYYTDMHAYSVGWASTFRAWGWGDYNLGDKRVTFGGGALTSKSSNPLKQLMRDKLERNLKISAVFMNDESLGNHVKQINRHKPSFIRGYASSLYELALFIKKKGIKIARPKAVLSTAEMLLPGQREMIEEQLQGEVFDNWGCNDGGGNACECREHSGLHVAVERSVVEISENSGPANSGEVLLTDLHNYSMPFIRYANEDMGRYVPQKCLCGRNLPRLDNFQGRSIDFLVTAEGQKVHGAFFSRLFLNLKSFTHFQVSQVLIDQWIVKLIPSAFAVNSLLIKEIELVRTIIYQRTRETKLEIEIVDSIPAGKSGKWKFIANEYEGLS